MASTAHDPPEPRYDRFVMQSPTAALSAADGGAARSAVSASAAVLYDRRGARRATGKTSEFALSASARTAVLRIVSCVVAAAAGKRRSQATLVQARNACLRCKITTLFATCGSQEVAQNVLKCES